MGDKNRPLTAKEKREIEKQRRKVAKEAYDYHKQNKNTNSIKASSKQRASDYVGETKKRAANSKQAKKQHKKTEASASKTNSKIVSTAMKQQRKKQSSANLTREEKFRQQSEQKIRNLKPKDFEEGYYVDEFSARKQQERRARQIREQESEVIRRPKKPVTPKQVRRKRFFLYSVIFMIVLLIGAVLSLTVLFKTEKILVEGDKYYYEDQIISFSDVKYQQNIFISALTGSTKQIVDNLPYVEAAEINFSIPDTVIIKITNATPAYVIKSGKEYLLVSSKGKILEKITKNTDKLPELKCDELKSTEPGKYISFSNPKLSDILADVTKNINENKVDKITSFDVTDAANIKLCYDNRLIINLGLPEDIDYKIRTAMAIINEKLDPNNIGTISGTLDVSLSSTSKVSRYKPGETTVPPTTVPSTTAPIDDYTWNGDNYYSDGGYGDNYYNDYGDGGYGYSDGDAGAGYTDGGDIGDSYTDGYGGDIGYGYTDGDGGYGYTDGDGGYGYTDGDDTAYDPYV